MMNEQTKREYWQVFDNFRKSREARYAPRIARILSAQKAEFIHNYKAGKQAHILNYEPLKQAIVAMYMDAAITFGHKVSVNIKNQLDGIKFYHRRYQIKRRMPMGFNDRMQQLIEQYYGLDFLNLSSGISDTTRDILYTTLVDAQREGLGFDDIVRKLENTELSKHRSMLIARTETVSAANHGAMLAANESGVLVNKIWIATHDSRTRHDHFNVNPEPIGIDETFTVGSFQMMQPGDKGGKDGRLKVPAKEICNCRCVVAFQPVRDSSGRVIST